MVKYWKMTWALAGSHMHRPMQVGCCVAWGMDFLLVTDNLLNSPGSVLIIFETVNESFYESTITYMAFRSSRCASTTKKEEQEQDQHLKCLR